jgi:integrase/recombinase XerC
MGTEVALLPTAIESPPELAQNGKRSCDGAAAELLGDFLGGLKPSTRAAYAKDFDAFARWLHPPDRDGRRAVTGLLTIGEGAAAVAWLLAMDAGEANRTALRWRDDMLNKGLATATVARRLAALRSVVRLARVLGRVAWSLEIRAPKVEARRDVRGPDAAEFRRLWKVARERGEGPKARRDRAMVALLYDLALRRNEVCSLDLADVEADGPAVRVLRKGKREKARLSLPPATIRALEEWLSARGPDPGPLFCCLDTAGAFTRLERLDGDGLRRALAALGRRAGLSRPLRPHGLRHAAITRALDRGNDIRDVRKFSGHASLNTVLKYDDARDDTAARIARQVAGDRR